MALVLQTLTTLSPCHTDTSIFCSLKITCCHRRTGCSTLKPTHCLSITRTDPAWLGTTTDQLTAHPCLRDASTFLGSGTVLRGTEDRRPIVGRPWTDVLDRRLLFLCEETGAGDAPASGPGCGPRCLHVPFCGGISASPYLLSQGQRTGGLRIHPHVFDYLPFLV